MAFVVVRASQQVISTLFLTVLEPPRRYTSGQRASSALASVPGQTWNTRPCGSLGTCSRVECKSAQAGRLNAWPLGPTEVLAFGLTDHRYRKKQHDRRPTVPTPDEVGKRGGHGIGPYTGTRKRLWVLQRRSICIRAHRYNVPTPPSAQSGATIHPGRRTSTDAAGVWPAVGIAYPHSHPTQTWCRSSRRSQPCVAGCRKGKETCCMLMYACPSARVAPLPGAAPAVGTSRCWVAGDWACRSHR